MVGQLKTKLVDDRTIGPSSGGPDTGFMSQGWIRVIVLVLILLYLLPVWGFKYFPSVDGPSHIYNAHILNHLDHPAWIFKDYFELNLRPFPNWTGSLLMLALQKAASPLRAEKIFLKIGRA